jgi:hypothetical protein
MSGERKLAAIARVTCSSAMAIWFRIKFLGFAAEQKLMPQMHERSFLDEGRVPLRGARRLRNPQPQSRSQSKGELMC